MHHLSHLFCVLFCLFAAVGANAQQVSDAVGNQMFTLQGGVLYDAESKPVLTVKGNLVFKGTSESKDDMVLLVGTDNLFGGKPADVLDGGMMTPRFTIGKGGFYIPGNGFSDRHLIGKYAIGPKGDLVIQAGNPAITVATLTGDQWTTAEMVAVFYLFNEKLQLKEMLAASLQSGGGPVVQTTTNPSGQATLRRMWNTGDDDFTWDGQFLKRRWNSFDYEEWEFDGRILRRVWYDDGVEYEWDGKILKRRFNASTEEFEWDGRVLRRRWNTGNDEFIIQGGVVKRMWDTGNDEWELDGDMPIPVIAMIVFGLIRK